MFTPTAVKFSWFGSSGWQVTEVPGGLPLVGWYAGDGPMKQIFNTVCAQDSLESLFYSPVHSMVWWVEMNHGKAPVWAHTSRFSTGALETIKARIAVPVIVEANIVFGYQKGRRDVSEISAE